MEFVKEKNWLNPFNGRLRFRPKVPPSGLTRTFIIPTSFGLAFGATCFFLLLFAVGFSNNLIYFLVFYLISVALISLPIANENVNRITVLTQTSSDLFAGQKNQILFRLENRSRFHSYLIETSFDSSTHYDSTAEIPRLPPKSTQQVMVGFKPELRGYQQLPRLRVKSEFPFRLTRPWRYYQPKNSVLVFPALIGRPEFPIHSWKGNLHSNAGLFKDLKTYTSTDSVRRIDWRQSQKHQRLLVRNFENEGSSYLDLSDQNLGSDLTFEQGLSQLALWVKLAEESKLIYSFRYGNKFWPPGSGPTHYREILTYLATITITDTATDENIRNKANT